MLIDTLKILFTRDLDRLIAEIEQCENEADIWKVKGQIKNSGGNLCLHLVGNLNNYIAKELGGTNYLRNRELEFSTKNIRRNELIYAVQNTKKIINETLDNFDECLLPKTYPLVVFEKKTSTEFLLVHLAGHLTYHLGQINYNRRLIQGEKA